MFKSFLILIILSVELMSYNQIRSVNCAQYDVKDSLLSRIQKSNYNYVTVAFNFRNSNEIVGDGDVYENLKTDITKATVALSRYNLKIIPIISMSSKWAIQWKVLQKYENPNIGMSTIVSNNKMPSIVNNEAVSNGVNTLRLMSQVVNNIGKEEKSKVEIKKVENTPDNCGSLCDLTNPAKWANMGSNSWAFEKDGVDKSVIDIFEAIKSGFESANVNYSLEYVNIQHDEANYLNWSLIGGIAGNCGTVYPYTGNFVRGEVSASDVAYIEGAVKSGLSLEAAHQSLLADEIYRRVIQAESVFGSNIKLMLYAEAFDDQSWGGVPWFVKNGDKISTILMHNVITLPGLNEEQKKKVKKQIIPILWNHDGKLANVEKVTDWLDQEDYNSQKAFDRFTKYGYNFMYIAALQYGDNSVRQIKEWSSVAVNNSNYLGYIVAAWDVSYNVDEPNSKWNVIEFLPSVQIKPIVEKYVDNKITVDMLGRKIGKNKSSGVYIFKYNGVVSKRLVY